MYFLSDICSTYKTMKGDYNMGNKITFEMWGLPRKKLAQAVSEVLNITPVYKGLPTYAYEIGDLVLDREGSIFYMNL